jgi:hypothetical protein
MRTEEIKMRRILFGLIILALIPTSPALTDYQKGVLDGLKSGWSMAQRYCQAQAGDPTAYNQAVPDYNAWITGIFGQNETLMLKPIGGAMQAQPFSISGTAKPPHAIDASWNQTLPEQFPKPDSSGRVAGWPAEEYYSIGPALDFLRS